MTIEDSQKIRAGSMKVRRALKVKCRPTIASAADRRAITVKDKAAIKMIAAQRTSLGRNKLEAKEEAARQDGFWMKLQHLRFQW